MADDPAFKDFALYPGFVMDNVDKLKQGRVQVTVPGVLERPKWAEVCMPGSPFSNGMYVVPAIKSQVIVGFLEGDRDNPIVIGGIAPPVLAGGSRAATDPADLPKMVTIENDDWVVQLGKSGTNAPFLDLRSRPKPADNPDDPPEECRIVIDFDKQIMEINIPQAITIRTPGLLNLNGRLMQVRQRPVQEGTTPI